MEWYNVISIIVGALGGTAGFIGLYKAKSEKTSIDIDNMQEMLNEAHKMYDSAREEKNAVSKEFHEYKEETMKYITEFKGRFAKVEKRLDRTEEEVFHLKGAVYQGYRCAYPPKAEDCPVLKEYEKIHCKECIDNQ